MPTVMKISPQGQIRIPQKVLESLKIVPGDYIEMDVESGHAVFDGDTIIFRAIGTHDILRDEE